ncbi:MAG: hypothetical protein RJA25_1053 [Bacteroidota bacterium]|jgi:TrmH family RNA methyltransferase
MKQITSTSNPFIKKILLLQEKSRERKEEGLFVIDGWKETQLAIANNFEIDTILFRKGFELNFDESSVENVVEVSEEVFDKISYRGNTSKVVALAKPKNISLQNISLSKNPLIVVLDGIEKPGNVGGMLRTADATGADAVICCNPQTDIYNPNIIRSSVGCIFTQQIVVSSKEECYRFLQEQNIAIYTTSLKAANNYLKDNYTIPSAFVFGTEAEGVDAFWEEHSKQNIIIPMRGQNDSLNVSNAVAVILFEAVRQRGN